VQHSNLTIYTIGHSNQPSEVLIDALLAAGIELLVDVRQFPMSRRNPQFNHDALSEELAEHGIDYRHMVSLGGRRPPVADSPNTALTNAGFRGYADYMATDAFESALAELIDVAQDQRTAIMCAESLPWRCHRSLIADALVARGVTVLHLLSGKSRPHTLSPVARAQDGRVTYPGLL
jgi:uncharacterized protein (DUF488 family)